MAVSPRELRDVLGSFATGVTIITGVDEQDRPVGLTANSFNSVSLDPPLVLFSLDRNANCASAFAEGRPFVVNVLRDDQQPQSNHFASKTDDKFAEMDFTWTAGNNGCAVIEGALAHLECTCESLHEGGDHWIVIGRVSRIEADPEGRPLVFFRGRYANLND